MSANVSPDDSGVGGPAVDSGTHPRISRVLNVLLYTLGFVTVVWHLFYAWDFPMPRAQHTNIHLGLLLSIFYLNTFDLDPDSWRDHLHNLVGGVLLVGLVSSTTYVHLNFGRWLQEGSAMVYTQTDVLIGGILMLIAVHAAWRAYGRALGLTSAFIVFYGLFGYLFPGVFYHTGFTLERLIYMNSIAISGVYHSIVGIVATWVAVFIFYAGFVEGYGGIDMIIDTISNTATRLRSGVVQIAVVSSMLVGTIMGSSAANVATTGSFTIPLMKNEGIESKHAASVEAIASNGGQVLPPIMGSAAFIMADLLGIGYFNVIVGALLPAILYYLGTFLVVHLSALKHGWGNVEQTDSQASQSEQPVDSTISDGSGSAIGGIFSWETVRQILVPMPYWGTMLVLIYTLVILQYSPLSAGLYAVLLLIGLQLVRDMVLDGISINTVTTWGRETLNGCKVAGKNMALVTAVAPILGIMINVITRSGFTQRFTFAIIGLASGILVLALILTMLASIAFGMGLPTPAAYVVVAILTAPVLIELGVDSLASHLFVLYFAILSTVTPPVAVSCAIGSGIANAGFGETCASTIRMGLFAFMLPFGFVMKPSLIYWDGGWTAAVFAQMAIGLIAILLGLIGHDGKTSLAHWQRAVYFVLGAVVWYVPIDAVGLGLAGVLAAWFAVQYVPRPSIPKITRS